MKTAGTGTRARAQRLGWVRADDPDGSRGAQRLVAKEQGLGNTTHGSGAGGLPARPPLGRQHHTPVWSGRPAYQAPAG